MTTPDRALTREEYDALSPESQGYVSYMQGEWNPDIPDANPYPKGSLKHMEWQNGAAAIDVQEIES